MLRVSALSSWFIAFGVLLNALVAPLGWGSCCCSAAHVQVSQTGVTPSETASDCCSPGEASSEQAPAQDQNDEDRPVKGDCECTLTCGTAKVQLAPTTPAGGWEEATVVSLDGPGDAGLISDDYLDRLKRPPKATVTL